MRIRPFLLQTVIVAVCLTSSSIAQQNTTADAVVPNVINYSGTLTDLNGKPLSGIQGVTFLLYSGEEGGAPLWMETQNITPGRNGQYTVTLGSTSAHGLPSDLFSNGEARWLAVQVIGQLEQPRVLLVAVPYALKAADAATIGGLPPSAFMMANGPQTSGTGNKQSSSKTNSQNSNNVLPTNPNVTGKGVVDFIPMWDTTSDIIDSIMFQKTSQIGINTITPSATLDVNGKTDVRDTLTLFPKGTDSTLAISGATFKVDQTGKVTFIASQTFPGTGTITGITTPPTGGLQGGGTKGNLSLSLKPAGVTNAMLQNSKITLNANTAGGLTAPGAMTLGSTFTIGLKPCSTNQILQFSGATWNCSSAGTGTVTSVGSGAGLTGGPITGSGSLSIATAGVTNVMLQHPSLTVNAGTALTGGGVVPLGSAVTLNLDTTKVPLLIANNSFNGNQSITGNLGATGTVSGAQVTSAGIVNVDENGANIGSYVPSLQFGAGNSGETIASARVGGSINQFGLDFYTSFTPRMSVTNLGQVGIGTQTPTGQLTVQGLSSATPIITVGFTASSGSGLSGSTGLGANGGSGDSTNSTTGGDGIDAFAGTGGRFDGTGGYLVGGNSGHSASTFGDGVDGIAGSGLAGFFQGNISVTGSISAGVKDFKIDHPLDPGNKYLVHASVESSEMMNIYTGNVTTDAQREATVQLPDWFEVLNTDFRYQLTVIGQFAQAIVSREIQSHQFTIRTNAPNVKVSWQITGVRQDSYAKADPLVVEEPKEERLKGFYIHPELFGAPEEKGIEWARHPQMMKKIKEMRKNGPAPTVAPTPRLSAPAKTIASASTLDHQ